MSVLRCTVIADIAIVVPCADKLVLRQEPAITSEGASGRCRRVNIRAETPPLTVVRAVSSMRCLRLPRRVEPGGRRHQLRRPGAGRHGAAQDPFCVSLTLSESMPSHADTLR